MLSERSISYMLCEGGARPTFPNVHTHTQISYDSQALTSICIFVCGYSWDSRGFFFLFLNFWFLGYSQKSVRRKPPKCIYIYYIFIHTYIDCILSLYECGLCIRRILCFSLSGTNRFCIPLVSAIPACRRLLMLLFLAGSVNVCLCVCVRCDESDCFSGICL